MMTKGVGVFLRLLCCVVGAQSVLLPLNVLAEGELGEKGCIKVAVEAILSRDGSVEQALKYIDKENRIKRSILRWVRLRGHDTSEVQFLRSKTVNLIHASLQLEQPFRLVNKYELFTREVKLSYFLIQDNLARIDVLKKALKRVELAEKNGEDIGRLLLAEGVTGEVPSDLVKLKKLLRWKIDGFEAESLVRAKFLARNYDEYEAVFAYLERVARGSDELAKRAKKVLEGLEAKRGLRGFFAKIGGAAVQDPKILQIRKTIELFDDAKLERLRYARRLEVVKSLKGLLPTEVFYKLLSSALQRIPWIDKTIATKLFSEFASERQRLLYFSDVQRIVHAEKSAVKRFELLKSLNAGSQDELLVTFARRIDLDDDWRAMVKVAEQGGEAEKEFLERMLAARVRARALGDMSLEKMESTGRLLSRFVDAAVGVGGGYLIYRLWPTPVPSVGQIPAGTQTPGVQSPAAQSPAAQSSPAAKPSPSATTADAGQMPLVLPADYNNFDIFIDLIDSDPLLKGAGYAIR